MRVLPTALGIVVFSMCGAGIRADSELPRFLCTANHAIVLGDRQLVSPGTVIRFAWSPDSRYIIAVRRTIKVKAPELVPLASSLPDVTGETAIVLLGRQRRRPATVWRGPTPRAYVSQIRWLTGEPTALISVAHTPATGSHASPTILLRMDAARGTCAELGQVEMSPDITLSPTRPFAGVISGTPTGTRLWVIRPNGQTTLVNLPGSASNPRAQWSRDGSFLTIGLLTRLPEQGQPPSLAWYTVDPTRPAAHRVGGPPEPSSTPPPAAPEPSGRLETDSIKVSRGQTSSILRPLWLESTEESEWPRMLICGDAEEAQLSPDASGIVYVTDGAAWFAPLVNRPKDSVLAVIETMEAHTCRANMAAIASAESAFGLRYGAYTATPMQDFNRDNPAAGGLVGAPEGLSVAVDCPSGGSYQFSVQDGAFTISCPHGDHHATRAGKPDDYRRTLQAPK